MLGKLAFYYFWAPNFSPRFTVHKSDVITDKDGCDMSKHVHTKFTNGNKVENIEVQLIKQMQKGNYDLEGKM